MEEKKKSGFGKILLGILIGLVVMGGTFFALIKFDVIKINNKNETNTNENKDKKGNKSVKSNKEMFSDANVSKVVGEMLGKGLSNKEKIEKRIKLLETIGSEDFTLPKIYLGKNITNNMKALGVINAYYFENYDEFGDISKDEYNKYQDAFVSLSATRKEEITDYLNSYGMGLINSSQMNDIKVLYKGLYGEDFPEITSIEGMGCVSYYYSKANDSLLFFGGCGGINTESGKSYINDIKSDEDYYYVYVSFGVCVFDEFSDYSVGLYNDSNKTNKVSDSCEESDLIANSNKLSQYKFTFNKDLTFNKIEKIS